MRPIRTAVSLALTCFFLVAQAQPYPVRPVKMVVPFSPVGPNDIIARLIGFRLAEALGQQVVIDNRPGGGGNIGTDAVGKAQPGRLNYASSGPGSSAHVAVALFASMAHIDITHVPYRGTGPGVNDLVAGQVQLAVFGIPPVLPHIKQGRLRALGVTGKTRSPELPDVPTLDEAGVPGYVVNLWYGLLAPAGTPAPLLTRLAAEVARIVHPPA